VKKKKMAEGDLKSLLNGYRIDGLKKNTHFGIGEFSVFTETNDINKIQALSWVRLFIFFHMNLYEIGPQKHDFRRRGPLRALQRRRHTQMRPLQRHRERPLYI
jgi:hypothetical protein